LRARQVLNAFRPEIVPVHPRNPQQQSITGQAKDEQARGKIMRVIPSVRSFLLALIMLAVSAAAFAQIGISITIAPPALPVYEQPPLPAQGYMWTPGYWAYSQGDYYWVPGTWVMAPQVGFLWTPGYWGWGNGGYAFNEGYWGPHVGFYGGINYGYGYTGDGYQGGRWDNGQFAYNRAVNNVNVTNIHNTYNTTVINNTTVNRVSYNGGTGGVTARPNSQQEAAAHERHIAPLAVQTQHAQAALANPQQRASVNQGKPAIAATPKPGAMNDRAAVPAKEAGAPYKPAEKSAATEPTRNDVPRPPNASEKASAPRPENTPRPETAHAAAPQPEKAPTQQEPKEAAPRPEAARPVAAAKPENESHGQSQAHPEAAPRPQTEARPENEPKPEKETAPKQAEARPENAPKPEKEAAPEERRQQ
jgi:WXXGXW repeat (2 copies)